MPAHQSSNKSRGRRPVSLRRQNVHIGKVPSAQALVHGVDNGAPLVLDSSPYIASSRERGWGAFLDGFLNRNRPAFEALDIRPQIVAGRDGARLELKPGIKAGAIPLRSAVTGQVAGGVVIRPRFGWSGVGRVLSATGWGSGPEFLSLPLVPGSGREIPPWVLAGPVLHRVAEMLAYLRPGYRERCETRTHPRGQIIWNRYIQGHLGRGAWHQLPCRFSELEQDDRLRQAIRWTLERVRADLVTTGSADLLVLHLVSEIKKLLGLVSDVIARQPRKGELELELGGSMASSVLREGLRAMGWIVDERGLGGGRSSDGLAWALSLDQLWERYVEHLVREQAKRTGGLLRLGRSGETTVPIPWTNSGMRSLGHLIPDFVIYRPNEIEIIDAKYKSHFADLDGLHWSAQDAAVRESMRADIHQVLAYAATVDVDRPVKATLFYPVPAEHFSYLEANQRVTSEAAVAAGTRTVRLCLRAAPFGSAA